MDNPIKINAQITRIPKNLIPTLKIGHPVSSPDVYGVEQDLYNIFEEVKNSVEAGDMDRTRENYGKFMKQLELRNSMCKGSKKLR